MDELDIDLEAISEQHGEMIADFDQLCEKLASVAGPLSNNDNECRKERLQSYTQNKLTRLSTDQNVESVDQSLLDLNARKQWLSFLLETVITPEGNLTSDDWKRYLDQAKEKIDRFQKLMDDLSPLLNKLLTIEKRTNSYICLLSDERRADIAGSRFIYLLEGLRIETERLEVTRSFPRTVLLIDQWQADDNIEDEFKPKVLNLCQIIEEDLSDQRLVNRVRYRIGVLGHTSAGKSALILKLSDLTQFSSMINLQRSTFGYLQFDSSFEDKATQTKIPVSYIDIAGATDNDASRSVGNYLELISNADCDVYLLVYDKPLDEQNRRWLDYVEKTLERKCLLVRSKADLPFHQFYKDKTGATFQVNTSKQSHLRYALQETREYAAKAYDGTLLKQEVFLTGAGQSKNELADTPYGQFDLVKLTEELQRLARTEERPVRIFHLAVLASKTAINTCFRRGYVVSKMKYRWLSAATSFIPFLNEIPAFFGREKIRQAFGIHDRSMIRNMLQRKTNTLEEYLIEHQLSIPQDRLNSGYFQYLVSNSNDDTNSSVPVTSRTNEQNQRHASQSSISNTSVSGSNVVGYGLALSAAQLSDDVIRAAVPISATAARGLFIAGVVVSVALAPVSAAWSFYSSGNRMNRHLHLLCDDLQIVFVYLINRLYYQ